VDKIMKYVDKNDSGAIDYSEFVLATINRGKLMDQRRLEMAFKMFDKDGSGLISTSELRTIFGGNQISEKVWTDLILEVDENGDG
jgi:calcium-dependent protein kinase